MNPILSPAAAEAYASWFRALADPTRLRVLHVLACALRPMRVGEVAEAVGIAQSTASVHLQRLLADEFVLVDRSGTASWYVVNAACLEQFPQAAEQVMGTLVGTVPLPDVDVEPPWQQGRPAANRSATADGPAAADGSAASAASAGSS